MELKMRINALLYKYLVSICQWLISITIAFIILYLTTPFIYKDLLIEKLADNEIQVIRVAKEYHDEPLLLRSIATLRQLYQCQRTINTDQKEANDRSK